MVAAEASSSLYGLRLLQHWKSQGLDVDAFGIGSRDMEKAGFRIIGRSEELAVVGLQEIISNFGLIKNAFHGLLDAARECKPNVALLLDYPDFNLRLAKKLKAMGIPVVYYISPQIWAWRPARVKLIKERVDKMLVLFPFEKKFYDEHDVRAEFVGHPLLDELDSKFFSSEYRDLHRAKYGVLPNDLLLALMPGSRHSEIKHHLDVQLQAARRLYARFPALKIALLVAPTFEKDQMQSLLDSVDFPLTVVKDEPFEMIHLADAVLCASGTATLMVGLMEKPMVIMYRMNSMTAFFAKRFVNLTRHFGLINLILDERAVPEVFQEQASPANLAGLLGEMIGSETYRDELRTKLASAKDRLGDQGATRRVARSLEEYGVRP